MDFIDFLRQVANTSDVGTIFERTRQFASAQAGRLQQWTELTDAQRAGLLVLQNSSDSKKLKALAELKGANHPAITNEVVRLLRSPAQYVRSAAAGWLGLAKAASAIQELKRVVCDDNASVVRIEAALALQSIGNEEAVKALSQCREQHPGAVWSAIELSAAS